jgi:catechol 2,3-dioxygenase-like lactoylglutathione lyase family enzyme
MINGVHHAGLSVRDLEGAIAFYCDAAGLSEVRRFKLEDDEEFSAVADIGQHTAEVALLEGSNAFLAVARFDDPDPGTHAQRPVSDAGITHICSQAQEIESLEARYRKAGAFFREKPIALGTGTIYAYVQDPESNTIELEATHYAPATRRPWLNHVALSTHDIDRLSTFYADLVGREVSRTAEFGNNPLLDKVTGLENTQVKAAWIKGENQTLEILQYLSPATVARTAERPIYELGWAYCCFEVVDIEGEYKRIKALGAHFVTPPRIFNGTKLCFARDPDGNLFALLELPAAKHELSLSAVEDPDLVLRSNTDKEAAA